MSRTRIDVVMTTVGDGRAFFDRYAELLENYHADNVRIVVIADRRTPAAFFETCARARARGLRVVSPTVAEQDALLARLGAPHLVPYNSDNRRNVGYLLAWMTDADLVISVDDDNFPVDPNFFAEHSIVARGPAPGRVVNGPGAWWNPCEALDVMPAPAYPRGFPFAPRGTGIAASAEDFATTIADVRVNAGLWLGEPDIDAMTRLTMHPAVTGLRKSETILGPGVWCPVNSQNTALHADVLPAYYFTRMGYRLGDQVFDRYADIFSGYFVQACCKHFGHAVRFGTPLVDHRRNEHSLLRDLRQELYPLMLLEDLLPWLLECRLEGTTYTEAYASLSYQLQEAAESMRGEVWTDQVRGFLHQMAHLMRQWLAVLERGERGNGHIAELGL